MKYSVCVVRRGRSAIYAHTTDAFSHAPPNALPGECFSVDDSPGSYGEAYIAEGLDVVLGIGSEDHHISGHAFCELPSLTGFVEAASGDGGQRCQDLPPVQPAFPSDANSSRVSYIWW